MKLLHVGSIVDLGFPSDSNMTHIDPVDQNLLINYYKQAKIFVLPSREEGLAMVQAQALACGLPIVCSMHTGGRDLRNFLLEKQWIIEMQVYTNDELEKCIFEALTLSKTQNGLRCYSKDVIDQFSWSAYGIRYNNKLKLLKS